MSELKPLFDFGRVCVSRSIGAAIKEDPAFNDKVMECLGRHVTGDWGDMSAHDKTANNEALKSGEDRIFSGYETTKGKILIITEWDRSYTTVMFPAEY